MILQLELYTQPTLNPVRERNHDLLRRTGFQGATGGGAPLKSGSEPGKRAAATQEMGELA